MNTVDWKRIILLVCVTFAVIIAGCGSSPASAPSSKGSVPYKEIERRVDKATKELDTTVEGVEKRTNAPTE